MDEEMTGVERPLTRCSMMSRWNFSTTIAGGQINTPTVF